ncbi:hypothetical protein [Streptomyces sp. YIM 121038]|uniref:hypothetical protein n=1 Tax=Streptomyces sp. YIM 121038 TaxID=2136401 RepID=UPI001110C6A3|nr:hypothetical protein [Streptomyces sp. YIM 121038]
MARIGLLPDANQLRPNDVVVARVAAALGATRSTNRDTQQGERTNTAFQRDWDAVRVVMELLIAADDPSTDVEVHPRTRLVAFPESAYLIQQDYELLHLSEQALEQQCAVDVLPVGAWHADLQARLSSPFEEEGHIAA